MTNHDPQENQNWYIEQGGTRRGPYSTRDIQNFVMEGTLLLEDQITDAFSGQTQAASHVFLPLNQVLRVSPSEEKNWQPPPRPADIRTTTPAYTIHAQTREIDYFALISHSKKKAPLPEGAKKKSSANDNPQKMVQAPDAQGTTHRLQLHATRLWQTLQKSPQSFLYKAAALGLVSTGIFGIVKYMPATGHREPAAAPPEQGSPLAKDLKETTKSKKSASSAMPSASENAIGRGQNPMVSREQANAQHIQQAATNQPQPAQEEPVTAAVVPETTAEASPPQGPEQNTGQANAQSTEQAPVADRSSPSPQGQGQASTQEPSQHFDPSTFEAINSPVTPPEIPVNAPLEPSLADRAPAAPDAPVADVPQPPAEPTTPEGQQDSTPTP